MPQYSGMWTLSQVSQAVKNQTWTGLPPSIVEYLVVAGGGAGGAYQGGGGGAGGLLAGYAGITLGASYFVTVGAGASAPAGAGNPGTQGTNSVFDATSSNATTGRIVATGGGGGSGGGGGGGTGTAGGSGGGGGSTTAVVSGLSGISGQGNAGGKSGGQATNYASGGGGGAGTVGISVNTDAHPAGNGGSGIASSISGRVAVYAGGGGGGATDANTFGLGGVGGGGDGGSFNAATNGNNATVNTGGGGGGGGNGAGTIGGAGGSGIVILRYPGSIQYFTGGTLSYANGYVSHTFYANGTLVPTTPTLYANPDYQIARSLRFNSADTAYLSRTPGSATNRKTFTWSGWVKRSALPAAGVPIFSTEGTPYSQYLCFGGTDMTALTTDALCFFSPVSGSAFSVQSANVYRDVSAWYHIVCAVDTTQATAANRVRLYVNGSEVSYGTSTYPAQNLDTYINSTGVTNIGSTAAAYFRGYITDVNFIDGQALTPSSFGWTNPATGVWAPLDFVGSYGTNGFNLTFSDNSNTTAGTLGADSSGNGNNFTPNGFSVSAGVGNDSLLDTPTPYGTDTGVGGEVRGNYATLNAVSTAITLSNGNLAFTAGATNTSSYSTIGVSSGKWYAEAVWSATGSTAMLGVALQASADIATFPGGNLYSYGYEFSGAKYNNNSGVSYGATWTNGDVIGVALDLDAGTITFYKNGTSQGVAFSGLQAGTYFFGVGLYSSTGNINFGQRPFAYTAPSGHKALNTQNLPTPTIGATSATLASEYFNTVLFYGKNASNFIPVGFAPDFAWTKSRNQANGFNMHDTIRGNSSLLYSDLANAASSYSNICAFGTEGVTLANTSDANAAADSSVGWFWRGGGTAVTNTSGSISSQVSASPTSGFSVVTYTGNGTAGATIGHGLNAVPQMILVKNRSTATSWRLYHVAIGNVDTIFLDTDAAIRSDINPWNSTTPTSTVITLGSSAGQNESGSTFVGYCFAPVAGYSAFGSYDGNGNASGPFVHLGFRPAFLLIRSTGNLAGYHWFMFDNKRDPYNLTQNPLGAANATAEPISAAGYRELDMLSNGFKIRASGDQINYSTQKYIYMAFAENPFKYSLAR